MHTKPLHCDSLENIKDQNQLQATFQSSAYKLLICIISVQTVEYLPLCTFAFYVEYVHCTGNLFQIYVIVIIYQVLKVNYTSFYVSEMVCLQF